MHRKSSSSVRVFFPKRTREEIIRHIQESLATLQKMLLLKQVVLFGSYAHGNHTVASDVDLLVIYKGGLKEDAYSLCRKIIALPGHEHVVLGLLMIQSLTIYGLNRAFKQGISLFYSASYGSLQAAVKSLLGKGWIVFEEQVEQGRNKKVYSITEQGRQEFHEWMLADIPANKLEVTALSKVFFLGLIESMEQKRQIVREILNKVDLVQKELSEMQQEISRYEIPDPYREIFKYQMKTLDYGLHAHDLAREWFGNLLLQIEGSG